MRSEPRSVLTQNPGFPLFLFLIAAFSSTTVRGAEYEGIKDHIFFLGLDVFVLQPEGLLPIGGFERGCVDIVTDDGKRVVKLRDLADLDTKIEPKVSTTSVSVSQINGYRSYTPANDPRMNALRAESALVAEQMQMETTTAIAESQLRAAEANMGAAMPPNADAAAQADIKSNRVAALNAAQSKVHQAELGQTIDTYDPIWNTNALDGSTADAYTVQFDVASEELIEDGYIVLVTNIIFPNGGGPVRALEFSRFSAIDQKPRKMKIVQSPLPIGFRVDQNEVHVYRADGREVATNLSQKRVELTKSEAFDFLLFRYVSSNKLENLRPTVVRDLLPVGFGVHVPQNQGERIAHIKVNDRGTVTNVHLEGSGTNETDAFLEEAIRDIYFFPALAYGEPVETGTTIQLSELVR